MKRVLSYSLFKSPTPIYWRNDGTEDRLSSYMRYLPALVRAHHAIWPGYEIRIHHDFAARQHPYFEALARMHERGVVHLVDCGEPTHLTLAMLWRMRPLFEEPDAHVVTADLDSLPILRLRRMVEEFVASGKTAMLVHGCDSHNGVLGGGIAGNARRFRERVGADSWQAFVDIGGNPQGFSPYAADEVFLREKIWPRLVNDAIVFRSNTNPTNIDMPDLRREPSLPAPSDLLPEVQEGGDWFAPYIGSAGYELSRAFCFYAHLPLPVMQEIRECEGESLDLNAVMRL